MDIEQGKSYRTRDGQQVTIVGLSPIKHYPFQGDNGLTYTINGIQGYFGRPVLEDIVADWEVVCDAGF